MCKWQGYVFRLVYIVSIVRIVILAMGLFGIYCYLKSYVVGGSNLCLVSNFLF
jgi:hypothetical protein